MFTEQTEKRLNVVTTYGTRDQLAAPRSGVILGPDGRSSRSYGSEVYSVLACNNVCKLDRQPETDVSAPVRKLSKLKGSC